MYDGEHARGREIFTGGKSAADVIGVGADGKVWVLEVKTAKNIKVGAVSELFFYSMVPNDVRRGRTGIGRRTAKTRASIGPEDVRNAAGLAMRLTAESFHPLLGTGIFLRLNLGAARVGWPIDYDVLGGCPARC